MSKKFALLLCFVALCLGVSAAGEKLEFKKAKLAQSPWNLEELYKTPKFTMGEIKDGVRTVVYEALDYQGKTKEVFAYYSSPGTLKGDPSLDKNLPAIVCAHGGGGKAFDAWVKKWAEKGYAAISMDQRGYGEDRVPLENGFKEGEKEQTPYFKSNEDQTEDWFYQAVADVVISHSLLLSLPEVDKTRTGITGISWGGIITTLVSGLDDRFKVAVPVYGCGYLYDTGSMAPQIAGGSELTIERWRTQYDPALHVQNTKIPMLFVDGTNDNHFYTNQWQATTECVSDVARSVRFEMNHGHGSGWNPQEIYDYVGKLFGMYDGEAAPEFTKLKNKKGKISCTVQGAMEGYKAFLVYTTDSDYSHKDKWVKQELEYSNDNIQATVGSDYVQWFITLEYPNTANYSSPVFFK